MDDRRRAGLSRLWCFAAVDGPKKNVAAVLCDRGDARQCRGAPQQRPTDHRARDRHAAGEGADLRALPERGRVGAGHDAGAAGLGWCGGYQFVFAGLPENVEYYVAAGPLVSPHYKVRVVDLPSVKEIRVTYQYPKWTGMKPVTEEHSGDLRAIEGTDAAIEIEMDHPLKDGQLALDGGQTIQLDGRRRQ